MSNHSSENTKGRLLRRALAGVLTLALMLGLLPASVFTAHAASWADSYVQTLVDWGVMRGDIGGNMAPNRSITRAEFVTMMNRAYGYKKLGGHPFTDVRVRDWYNEDIDIAYNIGYFKGTSDTTASPNSSLTREQAAVLLARNMMLQETVGETLGFSDTRRLSDWSRGLVGAAAANGIIGGYEDGSFQPMRNITRGEVAAMLVRAIGTPIQEAGDHALGNVYGNVTVNTSGVKLRDGVIAGNLYLTGGIDLGDVLLENVTVLGEIIVSGGGESNSSQSSIVLRNVVADKMVVDSISSQFVTIRAEGNTDIPTTTVRTNAYVDDSSLPGYGLSFIELDGEEGALYQLAGNIKEVINKTPGSSLQVVQGVADKVTVDEKATGSNVLVDGDAQVGDLNLDTGTEVTGSGDIKNLNVGSAGSTVEQLPDQIVIRPGIDADIGGSNMNSSQAAESSADPKLLAGYPAVRKIAPQSAELVFRVNKPGTIYWAVSSVADGSVSEEDLMNPPTYGNRVLASGTITATAANTDYTASVSKLTSAGSYYVTAMLVDGRGDHSPIKVTSFTTPDNSVPAFATGYPVMTMVTTEIAQVTVMTTKSCLLYYALLPKGAKAPTEAEFKSAAIPGNLGYGSQSVTKNVTIPINVNSVPLEEKTDYVLYLWLVDHDGAQKSKVVSLPFTTLDETPPVVTHAKQLFTNTTPTADSLQVEYTIDEPADFVWAIVTETQHMNQQFLSYTKSSPEPGDPDRFNLEFATEADLLSAKVQLASGQGALLSGSSNRSPLTVRDAKLLFENAKTSSFVLYYMGDDNATNTGNLSAEIKALRVRTKDETPPDVSLRFSSDGAEVTENPQADADVRIRFTEQVAAGKNPAEREKNILLDLYQKVLDAEEEFENAETTEDQTAATNKINAAKTTMAKVLETYIEFHQAAFPTANKLPPLAEGATPPPEGSWINWRNAQITMPSDGTGELEILLPGVKTNEDGTMDRASAAIQLEGGATYYFRFRDIYDLAYPTGNALVRTPDNDPCYRQFTTDFAQVNLEESDTWQIAGAPADTTGGKNDPSRADFSFTAKPTTVENVGNEIFWDMLIWADTSITFTLYERNLDSNGKPTGIWKEINNNQPASITVSATDGWSYISLQRVIAGDYSTTMPPYTQLNKLTNKEYAIHIDSLGGSSNTDYTAWNDSLNIRVSYLAGTQNRLFTYVRSGTQATYDTALSNGLSSIEQPSPFTLNKPFEIMAPPEILDDFPQIEVSDTGAKISLALDKAGQVYYLVLPMTQMFAGSTQINNTNTVLTEDVIATIDRFSMRYIPMKKADGAQAFPTDVPLMIGGGTDSSQEGLPVSQPDRDTVISLGLANSFPNSFAPANAAKRGETITIDLTDQLAANTVYYVFLVTRSESSIYSVDPLCYRFTTLEPQRPTINVDGGGGTTVNITVDKTTDLTYILTPNGDEGALFLNPFKQWADTTTWYSHNQTGWTAPPPDTIGTWSYKEYNFTYTQNNGDISQMTVVDAMATPCYKGSALIQDNYAGSVFDIFATTTSKNTFQAAIIGANIADGNIADKGSMTCYAPPKSNSKTFTGLKPGFYTFLSVGKSAQGSGYAFRAYYSVRVEDSKHPTVIATSQNTTATDQGVLSGNVTISLNDPLYYIDTSDNTRRDPHMVDNCSGHANKAMQDDAWALGDILRVSSTTGTVAVQGYGTHTTTPTAADQDIQVNFSDLREGDRIRFVFNTGLTNSGGVGYLNQLRVVFVMTATEIDPNATEMNKRYRYEAKLESITTAEWDAVTK